MEPMLMDYWGNTGTSAASAAATGGVSLGGYVWSLLLVLGLLLFLAWAAKRLLRLAPSTQPVEFRMLLHGRLGAGRSVVLWAEGDRVFCAVYRGRQVEFACPVPEVKALAPAQAAAGAGAWLRQWWGKRGGA